MRLFLSFEGVDGSGKTTMSRFAEQKLLELGQAVIWTREPGGTEVAEKIRNLLLSPSNRIDSETEILLFSAARCHHIKHLIQPALDDNQIVITDRYADSTMAYQCHNFDELWDLQEWLVEQKWMIWPDFTFYLKVSPEIATKRVLSRSGKSIDRMDQQFFDRVSSMIKIYDELAENCERIITIDANQTQKEVEESVLEKLSQLLE